MAFSANPLNVLLFTKNSFIYLGICVYYMYILYIIYTSYIYIFTYMESIAKAHTIENARVPCVKYLHIKCFLKQVAAFHLHIYIYIHI